MISRRPSRLRPRPRPGSKLRPGPGRFNRLFAAGGGARPPRRLREGALRFSENIATLEPSATLALSARARALRAEGRSIVDLSAGEPVYGTPGYAAEAAIEAIRDGRTGYPPTRGVPELLEAAARYLEETTRRSEVDSDGILVSAGVKQALFNCVFCLFGPGDEVLVPTPSWTSYLPQIRLAGARPVTVTTRWEDGFRIDPDLLESKRTDRTRGLVLNSPGNPTGAVYELSLLEEVGAWAGRHGIWLLSDEIYRLLSFGEGPAPSVFDLDDPPERTILLDGVSKAFSMPGFRIGFAAGPAEVISAATDLQSQTTSGASGPSQYAAAAALGRRDERERAVGAALSRLRETRRIGVEILRETPGLEIREPEGGIFLYARLTAGGSSEEATEELLEEAGVAAVPGEAFGSPGFLRFNFAVEPETLREGLGRVRKHFRERGHSSGE